MYNQSLNKGDKIKLPKMEEIHTDSIMSEMSSQISQKYHTVCKETDEFLIFYMLSFLGREDFKVNKRELVEMCLKNSPKKPYHNKNFEFKCPQCHKTVNLNNEYCVYCGQHLVWKG